LSEENKPTGADQPLARPVNEQELARTPIDEEREPDQIQGEQQETHQEESRQPEEESPEASQAEGEQEEKGLVDKAIDKAREKGLVDEQTATEVREKGLVDAIKDRLTGR
jgi:hypothetical protein